MSRRKPRSPGVMLRGRAAGLHYYDDEVSADGAKKRLRRRVRHAENQVLRRAITDETA